MSYFELQVEVSCPHCEAWGSIEHVEFNMNEADRNGVMSPYRAVDCDNCFKKFYFKANCEFTVDVWDVKKKKPKDIK
jgi:hypothetical protein